VFMQDRPQSLTDKWMKGGGTSTYLYRSAPYGMVTSPTR